MVGSFRPGFQFVDGAISAVYMRTATCGVLKGAD